MPAELLTRNEHRASQTPPLPAASADEGELRAVARRQLRRVRRLKLNAAAWALGAIVVTTLWVVSEWQANGALESFGHEGSPGQWNPTLWALVVGIWGLIVGIMALQAYVERPTTEAELAREVEHLRSQLAAGDAPADAELRRFTRSRLERIRRLRFHAAAWVLGMLVLTPLWALIEWQDNGGLERFGNGSQPGEWEPWILYVGGIWALVIAVLALNVYLDRPASEPEVERAVRRLESRR